MDRCLSSFSAYANQIIVGDSGSTDQTLQIAAEYKADIIHITWCDDYSFARNQCIAAAKNEWILFLDADEYLVGGQKLFKWLKKVPKSIGGCLLERKDAFVDHVTNKYCEVPIGLVRLFRKREEIQFSEPVHEIVSPSIISAGLKINVFTDSYIHHAISTHSKSFLDQKQSKYLKLLNDQLEVFPENAWARYQKGKTLWYFENIKEAKDCFFKVIDMSSSLEHKVGALNNLGAIELKHNRTEKAIHYLEESLKIVPNQSQAYFILGDCYLKIKNKKKALLSFLKVDTKLRVQKQMAFIPGGLFLYTYQKYYRLALSFVDFTPLSFYFIHLALKENPRYIDALYLKYQLLVSSKRTTKAEFVLEKIRSINPQWNKILELS